MYEIASWELAEMLGYDVYELQDILEEEWTEAAKGRYRSV
jgi:hypothetical protein